MVDACCSSWKIMNLSFQSTYLSITFTVKMLQVLFLKTNIHCTLRVGQIRVENIKIIFKEFSEDICGLNNPRLGDFYRYTRIVILCCWAGGRVYTSAVDCGKFLCDYGSYALPYTRPHTRTHTHTHANTRPRTRAHKSPGGTSRRGQLALIHIH